MNSTLYMALFENIPCYRYERTNRRVGQITRFISIVLIQGVSNQCVLHLTFRKEEIRTQAKENTEYLLDKVEMLKNFTENVSYVFKKKKGHEDTYVRGWQMSTVTWQPTSRTLDTCMSSYMRVPKAKYCG